MIVYAIQTNESLFETTTTLDGVGHVLRFKRIARSDRWVMDIINADGVLVAAGLRLVHRIDLTEGYVSRGVPGGAFRVISITQEEGPVTTDALGSTASLAYADLNDLEGIEFTTQFVAQEGVVT